MHVALFTPAWPPGAVANGILTCVAAMRSELLKQGHHVSLFAPVVQGAEPDVHPIAAGAAERVAGAIAARLGGRRSSVFDMGKAIAASIERVHARDPIDVVEMEESFGWVGDVAARTRIPVVCKLHGPAFLTLVAEELATDFGQEKVRREGEALARLPVVVAPSRYTLAETLAHYSLHPAIAEQLVNPLAGADEAPLWNPSECDRNTVLFVGRFDTVKGGDLAVLAFQRLLALRPALHLVCVGPDPGLQRRDGSTVRLPEFVASLNDPALARAITCTGPLEPSRVAALRPTAAVTLVPSRCESQGYTALEAMLQACPVVCADTSGLGEIVEHGVTGLKARAEDPAELAAQLQIILDDLDFGRSLGRAGRAYVLTHHTPAAVVARALDVYRRAIALHRSRGVRH